VIIMDLASIQPSLVEYVQAGVAGFVLKDATFQEFLLTIREVARERWSSRASSPHPPSPRLRLMLPRPAKETHSGLSG
jgi:DNA-binding NarL/FixJ family response regulator